MADSSRVRPGAGSPPGTRRAAAFLWLLYPLIAVAFLHDAVLSGGAYLLRDILTFFHPWQTAVRESLRAGALPFWNHDTGCGIPLLANLQSGVFYPPNWLFWFLSFDHALTIGMVVHLSLAAIFLRAFLRRAGLQDPAAFLGGLLIAFGTWPLAHLEAPMKLGAAVWLPLAWSGTWEAMREGRRRGLGLAGLAIALSLLAGYPQITALGLLSVAMLALLLGIELLVSKETTVLEKLKRLLALPAALALGILLAGVQLAPAREMTTASGKIAPYAADVAMARALPIRGLVGLVDPFFLGFPGVDRYWGGDAVEFPYGALYVGALASLLAVASFVAFRRPSRPRRVRREDVAKPAEPALVPRILPTFLVLGAVVGTALALGTRGGVWSLLRAYLPGFANFRWPATADFLVVAHVAGLAALGLAALVRERASWRTLSAAALAVGVALSAGAVLARGPLAGLFRAVQLAGSPAYQQAAYDAARDAWASSLALHGAIAAVAGVIGFAFSARRLAVAWAWCGLLLVDLFLTARALDMPVARGFYDETPKEVATLRDELHGRRVYTPRRYDQLGNFLAGCRNLEAFEWAKRAMLCNANVPAGIEQVLGADPLSPRRHDAFAEIFDDPRTPHDIRERIFDLWDAARLLELADVRPLEVPRIEDPSRGLTMNPHEPRIGRATLVSGWETLGGEDGGRVLDRLLAPDHDPRRTTLLERAGNARMPDPPSRPSTGTCDAIEYELFPNRIHAAWHVGPGGMLRILESWAPGWRAKVNGRPAPVYRADFLFLAVPVPEGSVAVELEYRPTSFPAGVTASVVGLLGLFVCFVGGSRRKVAMPAPAPARSASARRTSPLPFEAPPPPRPARAR